MSEYRWDDVRAHWVILAPERAHRPTAQRPREDWLNDLPDPFMSGREGETAAEVWSQRAPGTAPNTPGWDVRVVPNRYPAVIDPLTGRSVPLDDAAAAHDAATNAAYQAGLSPVVTASQRELAEQPLDLGPLTIAPRPPAPYGWDRIAGVGRHEVIIEGPDRETHLSRLSIETVVGVLLGVRERFLDWRRDPRWMLGVWFKNQGPQAGATLPHAHSQLIALPLVPPDIRQIMTQQTNYQRRFGRSYLADLLAAEEQAGQRWLTATDHFAAICPYASRFPAEIQLIPRRSSPHFEDATTAELHDLALLLQKCLRAVDRVLHEPPLNLVLVTSAWRGLETTGVGWWLEIVPRMARLAGFEVGTGMFMNPVLPETAAESLRPVLHGTEERCE